MTKSEQGRRRGGRMRLVGAAIACVSLATMFHWTGGAQFGAAPPPPLGDTGGGNPPVPIEGGAGEAEELILRQDEFYAARAFPNVDIPPGAIPEAQAEAAVLPLTSEVQVLTASEDPVFLPPAPPVDPKAPTTPTGDPSSEPVVATADLASVTWTPVGTSGQTAYTRSYDFPFYQGQAPLSGRVVGIAAHPTDQDTLYIASATGGLWKTVNGGTTWTPVFDQQPSIVMGAVAIDPGTPSTVWAATGEAAISGSIYSGLGVFRSTDAGGSWQKVGGTQFDYCHISDIVIKPGSPSTVVMSVDARNSGTSYPNGTCQNAGLSSSGIWRSTDGGNSWTQELRTTGTSDLLVDPGNPLTIHAGDWTNGYLRSADFGDTWVIANSGFPSAGSLSTDRARVELAANTGTAIYAAVATRGSALKGVYRSTDGGLNWTFLAAPPNVCNIPTRSGQCMYDLTIAVAPSGNVYLGGVYLVRTTDGGLTWPYVGNCPTLTCDFSPQRQIHVDIQYTAFDAGGRLWVATDGGVYRSTNGTDYVNLNVGLNVHQFQHGISGAGGVFWGGTQDTGSSRYSGGAGWTQYTPGDGGATALDRNSSPNTLYSMYPRFEPIYRSTDGGNTVTVVTTGACLGDASCLFYPPMVADPALPNRLYAGTTGVWRTTDGWSTKTKISGSINLEGRVSAIAPAASDANVVYAGTDTGRLWVTNNGGATWSNMSGSGLSGLPPRWINDINVDPANAASAYVSVSGFDSPHVYKTTNAGQTWTNISGDLPNTPVNAIVPDHRTSPATLYAGTDVGVFVSNDSGVRWTRFGTGMPTTIVMDLLVDTQQNTVTAATYGRGMWTSPIGVVPPTPTAGRIVFQRHDGNDYEIILRNSDGSEVQLTDNTAAEYDPVLSPDGTSIAFSTNRDGNYEIYRMNSDGTGVVRLTNNVALDEYPSWSADGASLAFDSNRDGNFELYRMNANGGDVVRLTNDASNDYRPAWSPDGTRIAWATTRNGKEDVYVSDVAFTGTPLRLTANAGTDTQPTWSPDSTLIAYATTRTDANPGGCAPCNYEVFTLKADGTSALRTQITNSPGVDWFPTWSTDGSELAFASDRSGNFDLWRASSTGADPVQLTTVAGSDTEPHWQPPAPAAPTICPPDDASEPNDTRETATVLLAPASLTATACANNTDWFGFAAVQGQTISAVLDFVHANGDIDVRLRDGSGSVIASSVSATDDETISLTAPSTGLYYLEVYGYQGAQNSYGLTLNSPACPPGDGFEPNGSLAAATTWPGGTSVRGLVCPGDDDYFAVNLAAGASIDVSATFLNRFGNVDLKLYGPSGQEVGSSLSTSDSETISHLAAVAGTYSARVYGLPGTTNVYDLAMSITEPPPSSTGAWPDFNGDGSADRSVFRPEYGGWFADGQTTAFLGLSGDVPVPGDYDGDATTERAAYRDGAWFIEGKTTQFLGTATDVPVPGDYDGDRNWELAVYRNGAWFIEGQPTRYLGVAGDVPVPGDYNGDGTTEIAVFRPSVGGWYVDGAAPVFYGLGTDVPVPGDYDGDGTTDRAVFRPAVGGWYVDGQTTQFIGLSSDVPVPADYDGTGTTDRAVYRPAFGGWYVQDTATVFYGLGTDTPLPLAAAIYSTYY